jgi:hypothetical protein
MDPIGKFSLCGGSSPAGTPPTGNTPQWRLVADQNNLGCGLDGRGLSINQIVVGVTTYDITKVAWGHYYSPWPSSQTYPFCGNSVTSVHNAPYYTDACPIAAAAGAYVPCFAGSGPSGLGYVQRGEIKYAGQYWVVAFYLSSLTSAYNLQKVCAGCTPASYSGCSICNPTYPVSIVPFPIPGSPVMENSYYLTSNYGHSPLDCPVSVGVDGATVNTMAYNSGTYYLAFNTTSLAFYATWCASNPGNCNANFSSIPACLPSTEAAPQDPFFGSDAP